jgi:hypothetical protein
VVASEEDQQRLEQHAGLFFKLDFLGLRDGGRVLPFAFGNVEGVVVLEDAVVVAAVDQYLVAVDLHRVEGSSVRHDFLEMDALELVIDAQQGVVELIP